MKIQIKFKNNQSDKELKYTNMYTDENEHLVILNKDNNNNILEEYVVKLSDIESFNSWND